MIVATARTAAELLAPHFAREGELVAALHLDSAQRLIANWVAEPGPNDSEDLPIREIVAAALASGADSLIVARGRAGGDPSPSEEECAGARRLAEAAAAAGLRLADFFIFADGRCRSFRELGLI